VFPVGIGLRDPRSQKRDLGHPSISPFDIAEGTSFVISLPIASASRLLGMTKERVTFSWKVAAFFGTVEAVPSFECLPQALKASEGFKVSRYRDSFWVVLLRLQITSIKGWSS
jgi:hypothetical protein